MPRLTPSKPEVRAVFDPSTSSVQYVVADAVTRKAAIIDPVLDFDEKSASIHTRSANELLSYLAAEHLTLEWILETHPHADHLSAAQYLKDKTGASTAIGEHVVEVQAVWREIYNLSSLPADGSQWDYLFKDGDSFPIGELDAHVIHSPGHTSASITYVVGDAAFIHDTLFMPDGGTARTDFPGGDPATLWRSIQRILSLPDNTRLFTGHDYQPGGREPRWESTVAEQKRLNEHIYGKSEHDFVLLRRARDKALTMPKLILPALQVNIDGGRLPQRETNGRRYLKLPLGAFAAGSHGGAE
jgi:glyoxylase-like metal-dependent hydrolase (beta-lactamase superfamily II)